MSIIAMIWDPDDDPEGNVRHCADHGVSKEEVEEVLENPTDGDVGRSSGRPVVFGDTSNGRLMVVFEEVDPLYRLPDNCFPPPTLAGRGVGVS